MASLAYGLLGGGVLQVLLLSAMLRGSKMHLLLARDARAEFWRAYMATVLAAAGLSALYFANQAIAGSLSGRDLAAFAYGTKLVTLFLAFCTRWSPTARCATFPPSRCMDGPS